MAVVLGRTTDTIVLRTFRTGGREGLRVAEACSEVVENQVEPSRTLCGPAGATAAGRASTLSRYMHPGGWLFITHHADRPAANRLLASV